MTRKILKLLNQSPNQGFNYRQIASKLTITDANGKDQIVKKLESLKAEKKVDEVERGKYKVVLNSKYYEGTLDVTSNGNAYFICDELETVEMALDTSL